MSLSKYLNLAPSKENERWTKCENRTKKSTNHVYYILITFLSIFTCVTARTTTASVTVNQMLIWGTAASVKMDIMTCRILMAMVAKVSNTHRSCLSMRWYNNANNARGLTCHKSTCFKIAKKKASSQLTRLSAIMLVLSVLAYLYH